MPSVHDTVVGIGFLLGESKGKEECDSEASQALSLFEKCAEITPIFAEIHLETII